MTDWYVSSAAYATYTAFQTSHVYSIGDIIKPTAPAFGFKWVLRCTTSGTSTTEPSWSSGNNATSTSGTAVFTNITGQSSFFWTAAAGDLFSILQTSNRLVQGDRAFLSSDHSETSSSSNTYLSTISGYGVATQLLCVNRAGSTPPVAADISTGATIGSSSSSPAIELSAQSDFYIQGITWQVTGTGGMQFGFTGRNSVYFKNCVLALNTASTVQFTTESSLFILDNTQLLFGSASQSILNGNGTFPLIWINTPSAIAGTPPTTLFVSSGIGGPIQAILRGVDLSAITGTFFNSNSSVSGNKFLLDSCKVNSGVTRLATALPSDAVELINCYDGTNTISERYSISGSVKTETTITLTGGAQDDIGAFSHKMVSNTSLNAFWPLAGFWIDVMNEFTGVSKIATVEIVSSTTLTNQDISLLLEYEGTAGTSMTSFSSSFIATPLTTPTNVTASGSAWNSLPATPVTQQLQVTFTPQAVGRLRGQVRLGKASTTVYYNPQIRLL